ncbi:MAG: purine-nucleoside phosphorylase [Bacteroidota bacterium]|nr:purine-nucleoside phosphorylase [Bacteroidota bacterium]
MLSQIAETAAFLSGKGFQGAKAGVVLGTGLGSFIDHMQVEQLLPYHEIPHFPLSTVEFHKGQLILGTIGSTKLIAMQGRFHYYEGYSMQQICFPIRVLQALGIQALFLSNAAGGMNPGFSKGDLVLIDDHINLLPENPLRGLTDPAFGNRFVDMSAPYDARLNTLVRNSAKKLGQELKEGVYVSVMGPNLETRAEYRYLRAAGADMVGMSTVPEVIVANHMGLACAAISVITDECDPDHLQPVRIEEILETAHAADSRLSGILEEVIRSL